MKLRSSVYGWKSVWMDIAEEFNGEFVDGTYLVTAKIPVPQRPWTITLQMHSSPIGKAISETTVISVPFVCNHPFRFAIHNSNAMEEVAKMLGLQDITIGAAEFDRAYIIQGSDVPLVKEFFANANLRQSIQAQKTCNLSVIDSHHHHFGIQPPAGTNVLTFVEKGAVNSFERLTSIVELLTQSLERLCQIEVASEEAPSYLVG